MTVERSLRRIRFPLMAASGSRVSGISSNALSGILLLLFALSDCEAAFASSTRRHGNHRPATRSLSRPCFLYPHTRILPPPTSNAMLSTVTTRKRASSSTRLFMVFDFFRERTKEGMSQIQNLQNAAAKGQLGQGLANAAAYTALTNQAFADGLQKSRNRLLNDLETLFTGVSPEDVLDELQDILLQADLGTATAEDIVNEVQSLRDDSTYRLSKDDLKSIMRGKLLEALNAATEKTDDNGVPVNTRAIRFQQASSSTTESSTASNIASHIPTVLFIMGANGMGKTTTIGKLAHRLRVEGNQTVVMAACDTFRAGAVDQLQQWADRAQVHMIGPTETATTPSAVVYAALDYGIANKVDTILVDTSGRLSNNDALTQELVKMKRVIQKRLSVEIVTTADGKTTTVPNVNVPHETLLVVDASQGRVALDSARVWNDALGLTGLILTKLDGSARGGSVVAVSRDLGLPVKLIGVGEGIEDLRDFDPDTFVDALLGIGRAGGASGSSSSEGAMLASRLTEMRRERDLRAKTISVKPKVSAPTAMEASPVGATASTNTGNAAAPNKAKKSNKSKKKKK